MSVNEKKGKRSSRRKTKYSSRMTSNIREKNKARRIVKRIYKSLNPPGTLKKIIAHYEKKCKHQNAHVVVRFIDKYFKAKAKGK